MKSEVKFKSKSWEECVPNQTRAHRECDPNQEGKQASQRVRSAEENTKGKTFVNLGHVRKLLASYGQNWQS